MSHSPHSACIPVRLLLALPLTLLAAFACFGFLATFELAAWSPRLPWLTGYTLLVTGCVAGVIALLRAQGSDDASHDPSCQKRGH